MNLKLAVLALIGVLPCAGEVLELKPEEKIALQEAEHPVHPCLWEVTGKDLKKPSYLFGTVHLSDPRITTLHPIAQKAFDQSDSVYGEIKMDPKTATKMTEMMVRKDGETVTSHIGEVRAARVNKFLKKVNPSLSLQTGLDNLQTWAISMTLPVLEDQMKGGKPLDLHLLERAEEAGKTTSSLETIESHIGAFQTISPAHELLMLDGTLDAMEMKGETNPIDELKEIYILKTPIEIGNYLKKNLTLSIDGGEPTAEEQKLSDWFIAELLDKRNLQMADKIEKLLESKSGHSHFFAVGAGHYAGKAALQDLLKKKGYTITPKF